MDHSYAWITPESEIIRQLRDEDLIGYITNSSAFHKGIVGKIPPKITRNQLVKLYKRSRNYATSSIVNGLTSLRNVQDGQHLNCSDLEHPFRILARVYTVWDASDDVNAATCRHYRSFSILENQNLSHFPGGVLYGYYTGITPEMIGYIYPMDANTDPWAENRLWLAMAPEIMLDLDDLVEKARKHRSYCQLSIFTWYKDTNGEVIPLRPDCVIAIDEVSQTTLRAAKAQNLPILTIHRAPDTLYHVHDDAGEAHNWTEWILPVDPNAPRYDQYDDFDITAPDALLHPGDPTCDRDAFMQLMANYQKA